MDDDDVNVTDDGNGEGPARKSRKAAVFDSDEEDAAPDAQQDEPNSSPPGDVNMAEVVGSEDDNE